MDKTIDIEVSKRIQLQIEKINLNRFTVAGVLDIRISSFNDIMSGKSPWRLIYLSKLALYFGVTTDELIFGDKDYIFKNTKSTVYEIKKEIKDMLIRDKKFKKYGELEASGFFDDIKE